MRIEVYNGWIIRTIPMNVILCKSNGMRVDKETGNEYEDFKEETSHASVGQALRAMAKKELNASKAESFKAFKKCTDKIESVLLRIEAELKEGELLKFDGSDSDYVLLGMVKSLEARCEKLEKAQAKKEAKKHE